MLNYKIIKWTKICSANFKIKYTYCWVCEPSFN